MESYHSRLFRQRSPITKRSVTICGHKTSISIEMAFWIELKRIAKQQSVERGQRVTLGALIDAIDLERHSPNLSSALRLFVLQDVKRLAGMPVLKAA